MIEKNNDLNAHDVKELFLQQQGLIMQQYGDNIQLAREVTIAVSKLDNMAKEYNDSWLKLVRDNARMLLVLAMVVVILIGAWFLEKSHIKIGDLEIIPPKGTEQAK